MGDSQILHFHLNDPDDMGRGYFIDFEAGDTKRVRRCVKDIVDL